MVIPNNNLQLFDKINLFNFVVVFLFLLLLLFFFTVYIINLSSFRFLDSILYNLF